MKTADIKVGEFYDTGGRFGTHHRVEVLEKGVPRVRPRYYYQAQAKPTKDGVKVRGDNGAEYQLASRDIVRPYAEYLAQKEIQDEHSRIRAEADAKDRAYRAGQARILDRALRDHGVRPEEVGVYSKRNLTALEAAGFPMRDRLVTTTVSGLQDFMEYSRADLADILPLLADAAANSERAGITA